MPTKRASPNGDAALATRVGALEQRVDALESGRPGRKAKLMIALRQQGVCALDPERDSATCDDASIFRYQMGCHGDKCRSKQHDAYERRKAKKDATPVKKTTAKKAPAKKAATTKVTAKKAPAKVNLAKEVTKAAAKRATPTPTKRVAKKQPVAV